MISSFTKKNDLKITDFMPSADKVQKVESKQAALIRKVKALFGGK